MSHYKPYPAYKDSGVEWLGRVPEHWQIKRLKHIANVQTGVAKGKDNEGKDTVEVPYLRVANVQDGYLSLDDVATIEIPREDLTRYSLQPGDVLMNEGGDFDKLGRGSVWQGEIEPCIHQNHVFAVRPTAVSSAWLNTFTGSLAAQFYFMGRAKQSTNLASISSSNIMELPVAMPPATEVDLLLAHIDRETARIDALIEKKTRFIELLREKRQALITHAVTKGLDPSVKMKTSGVEWLGEVPEHWDVLSFQRCVFIAEGQVDPEKSPYREMVLLAPNHIESGSGLLLYTETAEEQNAESGKYLCQKGDVVYSKIRPALRKVCIAPDLSLCSADMYPMRGHSGMSNQFLFWFLLSEPFSAFAVLEADRVAMPKINRESLNSVQLPRPPINEQMEIVAWVAQSTARLDNLRAKTERSIELLKERRSALITAAVTGQIDLREAV